MRPACGGPHLFFFPFKPGIAINRCAALSPLPTSSHAQLHAWLYPGFSRHKIRPFMVSNLHFHGSKRLPK